MTTPPPLTHQSTSIKMAALIPGMAVLVLGGFVGLEILFGGSGSAPPPPPLTAYGHTTSVVPVFASTDPLLAPPLDIQRKVLIPEVCTTHRELPTGGDAASPSVAIRYSCTQTAGWLQAFMDDAIPHEGWKVMSEGPTTHDGGGYAVIAQQAGSDGYYWELGVVVGTTTFTPSASGVPTQSTELTVRIFQSTAQ